MHAPGTPGTFYAPPRVSDPAMHHGTCVAHVTGCMPGSITNYFLWSRWRQKRSKHSQHIHNSHFYVSGKRLKQYMHLYDQLTEASTKWQKFWETVYSTKCSYNVNSNMIVSVSSQWWICQHWIRCGLDAEQVIKLLSQLNWIYKWAYMYSIFLHELTHWLNDS